MKGLHRGADKFLSKRKFVLETSGMYWKRNFNLKVRARN